MVWTSGFVRRLGDYRGQLTAMILSFGSLMLRQLLQQMILVPLRNCVR